MAPAVFQILIALADQPLHGYGIMLDVAERSAGKVKMSPGTLYGSIKQMLEAGLIEETKSPPAAVLLKKAANIAAGSKEPNKTKVGKVTRKQVMDIVNTKRKDLNARDDEAAFRIIAGTARQMGLEIAD